MTTAQKPVMSRFEIPGDLNQKIMMETVMTGKTKPEIIIEILNKHFSKK